MTRKEKKHQATQDFSSLPSSFHLVIAASLRAQSFAFVHGLGHLGAAMGLDLFVGPLVALLQDLRHQVFTRPGWWVDGGWMVDVGGRCLGVVSRRYAMVCLIRLMDAFSGCNSSYHLVI